MPAAGMPRRPRPPQPMTFQRIGVLGAGAWGTALANAVARAGRDVTLWARDPIAAAIVEQQRASPRLPEVRLDARVRVTAAAKAAPTDVVLLAVPAQDLRRAAAALAPALAAGTPLVACAKGIERGTRRFMTEVIAEAAPAARPAILSGPSFASDVARGLPTAVALACADETVAEALAHALGSATFRPYHSTDVRGVEVGGAAKNVLAIAAGIAAGRGLGASAAAALTTRGFAELMRFGRRFGARDDTLTGLSGLGDLILTCSSPQSRNYAFGHALGRGEQPEALGVLAEGTFTASVLVDMAREREVDMPVAEAVAAVLQGTVTVEAAIESLLARPFRSES